MRFPYIKLKGKPSPVIPVQLKTKENTFIEIHAYVDSGAGFSIFHSDVSEILGFDLEKGKTIYVTVGDGFQIPVYMQRILIRLADKEFKATIGFSRHLGIGFNVIGRKDIFDRFRICFDDKEKFGEFYPKHRQNKF